MLASDTKTFISRGDNSMNNLSEGMLNSAADFNSRSSHPRYLLPIYLPSALAAAWAIMMYLERYPETFGKIMRWGDRIFLGVAAAGLLVPFVFAYYVKASLAAAVPYVVCLGLALAAVRKWLPLKAAGLFASFIILLLSIEVADSIIDDKTADYLRLSRELKSLGLAAQEIKFYDCSMNNRAQGAVSYYYNKLMDCSNSFSQLAEDPTVKGIVSNRQTVEKISSWPQIKKNYQIVESNHRFIILLKSN
jgi:hypothetical protein